MTIDDYLSQVTAALRVPAAQAGIEDLREALRERAAVVGEAAACNDFGTPQAYAADLDAAFASEEPDDFDPPPAQVFLDVPGNWSLDGSWWRRLFNPADPRIVVPHVFGWGYAVNLGAVAVRLRLLRPDDVDTDTLAELRPYDAAVPLVVIVGLAAANLARASWPPRDPRDVRDAVAAALTTGAVALPTVTRRPVIQRLAAQSFGSLILSAVLAKTIDRTRPGWGAAIIAGGLVGAVASLVIPVRAAVQRSAGREGQR